MKPNRIAGLLLLISLLILAAMNSKMANAQGPSVTPTPAVAPTPAPATSPSPSAATVATHLKVTGIEGHLELDTITPSLLGLMGISAGTALGEALIDSSKDTAKASQLQDFTAEKQSLEQSIPEFQSQINALNAKATLAPDDTANRDSLNKQLKDSRTRLAQLNQQLQTLGPADSTAGISQGLFRDILRDGSGYSFHRFQIFAWSI